MERYQMRPEKRIDSNIVSPESAENNSASDFGNTGDYVADILYPKYVHWESETECADNQRHILDYCEKKRSVEYASFSTQKTVFDKYHDCFRQEDIKRILEDMDGSKMEIYSEENFRKHSQDANGYRVLGMRDIEDGKIYLRDSEDVERLVHTASHETMHDLSCQRKEESVTVDSDIKIVQTTMQSGIRLVEKRREESTSGRNTIDYFQRNRYLNEGLTEMYTIEAMQERGEQPDFDSYTQEMGWAIALREIVGEDTVSNAYFGGDIATLQQRVDSMSSIPNAWEQMNHSIDLYHTTRDLSYKQEVDSILDDLQDNGTLVRRRTLNGNRL